MFVKHTTYVHIYKYIKNGNVLDHNLEIWYPNFHNIILGPLAKQDLYIKSYLPNGPSLFTLFLST